MLEKYRKIHWTEHVKLKMRQYGLSKMKLMNVLRKPDRKEEGIAVDTTAVMKTANPASAKGYGRAKGEIWLMYQDNQYFRKIISAWRYPGISKPGESIPIPKEIREELEKQYESGR